MVHYAGFGAIGGAEIRRRMDEALGTTMIAGQPVKPSLGKWTQLGDCLDWLVVALTSGVFPKLFSIAMRGVGARPLASRQ